jgi:hypothetical protein
LVLLEEAGHGLGKFTGEAHLVSVHALEASMAHGRDAEDDFEQEVIAEGLDYRPPVLQKRGKPAK